MVNLRDAKLSLFVIIVIVSKIAASKKKWEVILSAFEEKNSNKGTFFNFRPQDMSNCPAALAEMAHKVFKGRVQVAKIRCKPLWCKTDLHSDDTEPIVGIMKGRRRYFKHTCDFCAESCLELKKNGKRGKTYRKMDQFPRDEILRQPSTVYCISRYNRTLPKYCSSIKIHYLPELPSWNE